MGLQELYDLGARRIGILSLPAIGCVPSQRTLNGGIDRGVLRQCQPSSKPLQLQTHCPNRCLQQEASRSKASIHTIQSKFGSSPWPQTSLLNLRPSSYPQPPPLPNVHIPEPPPSCPSSHSLTLNLSFISPEPPPGLGKDSKCSVKPLNPTHFPSSAMTVFSKVPISRIRNFCIIAHIDHGKSTLADKLLETTGTVQKREMKEQFLDNMDLERERGITIKLQIARMRYSFKNGEPYCLNLIDTPGHVDFSYEVSRSLAACEGALLVVDASQGVEAQTLANVYLALENNLEIIPVLNKIDLPGADPDSVIKEIEEVIGLDCSNAILCSAKEGIGISEILDAIVERVPPPADTADKPLRALIFDSYYDPYRGVIVYFRVIDGKIKKGDRVYFMASGKDYFADEIGVLSPTQFQVGELYAGEVGYLSASIRSVADARVGDTITNYSRKAESSLPGYEEATQWCSVACFLWMLISFLS
ncbi:hypothetical protein GBA52_025284 [Prunus armeniaca]|nr:hypothetical protein GBA52_025284 [Prunus armeniaca]